MGKIISAYIEYRLLILIYTVKLNAFFLHLVLLTLMQSFVNLYFGEIDLKKL